MNVVNGKSIVRGQIDLAIQRVKTSKTVREAGEAERLRSKKASTSPRARAARMVRTR